MKQASKEMKSEEDMKKNGLPRKKKAGPSVVQDRKSSVKRKVQAFGYGLENIGKYS